MAVGISLTSSTTTTLDNATNGRASKVQAVFEQKKQVQMNVASTQEFQADSIDFDAECTPFSELFNQKVSYADVFFLFFEILRLYVKEHQFMNEMRKQAILNQISQMEQCVKQWKDQGKWALFTGVGAGMMSFMAGALPIIGHLKGKEILGALSKVFSKFKDFKKPTEFFRSMSTVSDAMGKMYESTGRVHQAYSEGNKTKHQCFQDLFRSEADEEVRRRDQVNQEFREFKNFLKELFDMIQEADRQNFNIR